MNMSGLVARWLRSCRPLLALGLVLAHPFSCVGNTQAAPEIGKEPTEHTQKAPASAGSSDVFDEKTGFRHFEAHGDRWYAFPGESAEISASVVEAALESDTLAIIKLGGDKLLAFEPGRSASNAYVLSPENGSITIESFFPLLQGLPNKVDIEAIHEWKVVQGAEADIVFGHDCGARLSSFAPLYAMDSPLFKENASVTLHIAAWAYTARKAENKPVPLNPKSPAYASLKERYPDHEPMIRFEGMRMAIPTDYASDYLSTYLSRR